MQSLQKGKAFGCAINVRLFITVYYYNIKAGNWAGE